MAKKQGFAYAKQQKISGVLPVPLNAFGSGGSGGSTADAETLTSMGTLITSGDSKATPVDSDEFAIRNSVGGLMAKVTWANIKATLLTTWKDVTGGLVGMTLYKINFKNAANTFTSFFTNANTAARTYTFQDRDGTIADNTDLALKAPLASPLFTGDVGVGGTPTNYANYSALSIKGLNSASGGVIDLKTSDSSANAQLYNNSTAFYIRTTSPHPISFHINSSEKMALTTGGVLDLITGQLKFPATQNASADANTLDDYEEGDVVVAFATTSGSITIAASRKTLSYTKIGRRVSLNGLLGVDSVSTPGGNIQITGLPFTRLSGDKGISSNGIKVEGLAVTVVGSVTVDVTADATVATIQKLSAGTSAALAPDVSSSSCFYVSLSYNI